MNQLPPFNKKMDYMLRKCLLQSNKSDINYRVPIILKTAECKLGNNSSNLFSSSNITYTHQFQHLPFISGRFSAAEIHTLSSLPEIEKLYLDRNVHAYCGTARKTMEADITENQHGLTGKGVTVAVLDTGIHPHPDFILPHNRIKGFQDFANALTSFYDDCGHGTHVAGCIAGNGYCSNGIHKGIAPEADLLILKVLDKNGVGKVSAVLSAIDYCLEHQETYNIRIMNMSFGLSRESNSDEDPIAIAAAIVVQSGIVVCAAADHASTGGMIASPASHPLVIAAGSLNHRDSLISGGILDIYNSQRFTLNGFKKPDFFFPGIAVTAPLSPESILAKQLEPFVEDAHYMSLSGSSMSSGFCSGTVALFLQAYPPLKPEDVMQTMKQSQSEDKKDIFKLTSLFSLKNKGAE